MHSKPLPVLVDRILACQMTSNPPAAPDLQFSLQQLTHCISRITDRQDTADSLEDVAGALVRDLVESLRDPVSGETSAALVRFFMTMPHESLDPARRDFIAQRFPDLRPRPDTKCLTLMGTVGDKPDWCEIERSAGHQSIPLMSAEWVDQIPMIARLFAEFGLDVEQVLRPGPDLMIEEENRGFRLFHVLDAGGSDFIPDQDFVSSHGIRSVLGFGGLLPTGHLFVVLLFSKARISRETANLFRAVALGVRMAILPLVDEKILAGEKGSIAEVDSLRAIGTAQRELLEVFRTTVVEQSDKLDQTLGELRSTNVDLRDTLDELRDAQSRLVDYEAKLVSKYAAEKLRDPSTYKVAFTVGTLINLFGQFLVPFLRGQSEVWSLFVNELQQRPLLAAGSITVAYLFPVIVQVHSAVRSRLHGHGAELRAVFPDSKPDPVFRAAADGRIIDAGAGTRVVLSRHHLDTAQAVIGTELWEKILELQRLGSRLPRETAVRVEALDHTFFVSHSPAGDGAVNLYLTEVENRA